jgi:hemoglobin
MNALPLIQGPGNPHYERVGGEPAVRRLVDAFYAAMDTREDARAIRAMHPSDLSATRTILFKYFTEWLGGPKQYTAERGPPRLRRVHMPFPIDAAASRAWLACMRQALDDISADIALREELDAAFAKIAAHLENTADSHPHHDHHRSL